MMYYLGVHDGSGREIEEIVYNDNEAQHIIDDMISIYDDPDNEGILFNLGWSEIPLTKRTITR